MEEHKTLWAHLDDVCMKICGHLNSANKTSVDGTWTKHRPHSQIILFELLLKKSARVRNGVGQSSSVAVSLDEL